VGLPCHTPKQQEQKTHWFFALVAIPDASRKNLTEGSLD